jgi:hypothetical protein
MTEIDHEIMFAAMRASRLSETEMLPPGVNAPDLVRFAYIVAEMEATVNPYEHLIDEGFNQEFKEKFGYIPTPEQHRIARTFINGIDLGIRAARMQLTAGAGVG